MEIDNIVWLASYPRSGNTLLRTILWHCFGLHSASIYPDDLGGNKELAKYVGHIELKPNRQEQLREVGTLLIKTHKSPEDNNPAIYVIRDGRAACNSLWKFWNGSVPLESIIEGQHEFGTWGDHVMSWDPWNRTNTLLLKYEQLVDDLPGSLIHIEKFLQRKIISTKVPDRNTIADVGGRFVNRKTNWRSEFSPADLERFVQINRDTLIKSGYM